RALELLDLTLEDPRWRNRLFEITRARELLCAAVLDGGRNTGPASRIWIDTSSLSLWRRGMRECTVLRDHPSPLSPRLLGRDRPSRLERRAPPPPRGGGTRQNGEGGGGLGGVEVRGPGR